MGGRGYLLFYSLAARKCVHAYRFRYTKNEGNFVLKQPARPPRVPQKSKTRKSVAKPRFFRGAVTIRGRFVLGFRLARRCFTRLPLALGSAAELAFAPSLEAKYRATRKRCQEKFGFEPQNIWCLVPGSSTCSGACASGHNDFFAPNSRAKHTISPLWKSNRRPVQKLGFLLRGKI